MSRDGSLTPEQRAILTLPEWPAIVWLAAGRPKAGPLADLMLDWLLVPEPLVESFAQRRAERVLRRAAERLRAAGHAEP